MIFTSVHFVNLKQGPPVKMLAQIKNNDDEVYENVRTIERYENERDLRKFENQRKMGLSRRELEIRKLE